jgi:hypothetical protein
MGQLVTKQLSDFLPQSFIKQAKPETVKGLDQAFSLKMGAILTANYPKIAEARATIKTAITSRKMAALGTPLTRAQVSNLADITQAQYQHTAVKYVPKYTTIEEGAYVGVKESIKATEYQQAYTEVISQPPTTSFDLGLGDVWDKLGEAGKWILIAGGLFGALYVTGKALGGRKR